MAAVDLDVLERDPESELKLKQVVELDECRDHPAELAKYVECLDTETGDEFSFELHDPDSGWYWQRGLLEEWLASRRHITLKARQLGITWLAGLLALWHLLFKPGTRVLIVSINDDEAKKVVGRIWFMYQSLPEYLRSHVQIVKPARGGNPSDTIEVRHEGGKLSHILALPSTARAGRGETAALVILDEDAYQTYARGTWTSVQPTATKGGRILVISTGNGISTPEGQGNFYHWKWTNADDLKIRKRFLNVFTHPDRDEDWYEREAASLPAAERGQEYPRTEREAFILSGDPYFDVDHLAWYDEHGVRDPLYRGVFTRAGASRKSVFEEREFGHVYIFEKVEKDRKYALAADTASGSGTDFSAAYVIDLSTFALVAEFNGKLGADLYAEQLFCLGRYYNNAVMGIEDAGAWGDAVIISLREEKPWRGRYTHFHQHRQETQWDVPEHRKLGYPVNVHTRPQILKELSAAIRQHAFPYLSAGCLLELQTFVHRDTNPSPRAMEGCNDDRVMALALACQLYRDYGGERKPSARKKEYVPSRPWEGRKGRKRRLAA